MGKINVILHNHSPLPCKVSFNSPEIRSVGGIMIYFYQSVRAGFSAKALIRYQIKETDRSESQ